MKRLLSLFALATFAIGASAAPTTSNLIVNGGFESTAVANGSWVNVPTIAGWTWLSGPGTGFEIRNNVAGAAQEGKNYIELDTNGNTLIGQYLDNLVSGATYDLSFWYSAREYVAASSNGIQMFWNGVQIGDTLTGTGGSSGNNWSMHEYLVTAQAGRNLLSFASVGTSDGLGGSLDNVSLNRVPEPGSLALTFAALAGAFLLPPTLRRRAHARRAVALASALKRDA